MPLPGELYDPLTGVPEGVSEPPKLPGRGKYAHTLTPSTQVKGKYAHTLSPQPPSPAPETPGIGTPPPPPSEPSLLGSTYEKYKEKVKSGVESMYEHPFKTVAGFVPGVGEGIEAYQHGLSPEQEQAIHKHVSGMLQKGLFGRNEDEANRKAQEYIDSIKGSPVWRGLEAGTTALPGQVERLGLAAGAAGALPVTGPIMGAAAFGGAMGAESVGEKAFQEGKLPSPDEAAAEIAAQATLMAPFGLLGHLGKGAPEAPAEAPKVELPKGTPAFQATAAEGKAIATTPTQETLTQPAIKLPDGTILKGARGESHQDIIDRLHTKPPRIEHGFIDENGKYVSRTQARKEVNVKGGKLPPGKPRSEDLAPQGPSPELIKYAEDENKWATARVKALKAGDMAKVAELEKQRPALEARRLNLQRHAPTETPQAPITPRQQRAAEVQAAREAAPATSPTVKVGGKKKAPEAVTPPTGGKEWTTAVITDHEGNPVGRRLLSPSKRADFIDKFNQEHQGKQYKVTFRPSTPQDIAEAAKARAQVAKPKTKGGVTPPVDLSKITLPPEFTGKAAPPAAPPPKFRGYMVKGAKGYELGPERPFSKKSVMISGEAPKFEYGPSFDTLEEAKAWQAKGKGRRIQQLGAGKDLTAKAGRRSRLPKDAAEQIAKAPKEVLPSTSYIPEQQIRGASQRGLPPELQVDRETQRRLDAIRQGAIPQGTLPPHLQATVERLKSQAPETPPDLSGVNLDDINSLLDRLAQEEEGGVSTPRPPFATSQPSAPPTNLPPKPAIPGTESMPFRTGFIQGRGHGPLTPEAEAGYRDTYTRAGFTPAEVEDAIRGWNEGAKEFKGAAPKTPKTNPHVETVKAARATYEASGASPRILNELRDATKGFTKQTALVQESIAKDVAEHANLFKNKGWLPAWRDSQGRIFGGLTSPRAFEKAVAGNFGKELKPAMNGPEVQGWSQGYVDKEGKFYPHDWAADTAAKSAKSPTPPPETVKVAPEVKGEPAKLVPSTPTPEVKGGRVIYDMQDKRAYPEGTATFNHLKRVLGNNVTLRGRYFEGTKAGNVIHLDENTYTGDKAQVVPSPEAKGMSKGAIQLPAVFHEAAQTLVKGKAAFDGWFKSPEFKEADRFTKNVIRKFMGEEESQLLPMLNIFKGFASALDKVHDADKIAFMDNVNKGLPVGKDWEPLSYAWKAVNKHMEDYAHAFEKRWKLPNNYVLKRFKENYWPTRFKRKASATDVPDLSKPRANRRFMGTQGWRRARGYGDIKSSLAANPDFELISTNPVDHIMSTYRDFMKYITREDTLRTLQDHGYRKFVKGDKARSQMERRGWVEEPTEKGTVSFRKGGLKTVSGHYMVPEPVARRISSLTSNGLWGNSWYKGIRQLSNRINSVNLGLSGFHYTMTGLQAGITDMARGMVAMSKGHPIEGLKLFGEGLLPGFSAGKYLARGAYVKGLIRERMLGTEIMDPQLQAMVDSGWKWSNDREQSNDFVNELKDAYRKVTQEPSIGNALPAIWKTALAPIDAFSVPLFKLWVPYMKMGMAYDMMGDVLRDLPPGATTMDYLDAVNTVHDSVENRLGMMNYDRMLMNKNLQNALTLAVRAPGWDWGSFREAGGGVADLRNLAPDKWGKPGGGLSHRTAFILGTLIQVPLYGAILNYMGTGKWPEVANDFWTTWRNFTKPASGKKLADGTDERLQLPGYQREGEEWSSIANKALEGEFSPVFGYAQSKQGPLPRMLTDLALNKNWKGEKILGEGGKGILPYLNESAGPASVIGYSAARRRADLESEGIVEKGSVSPIETWLGVTLPKQRWMATPFQNKLREGMSETNVRGRYTQDQIAEMKVRRTLTAMVRRQDPMWEEMAGKYYDAGVLSKGQIRQIVRDATEAPIAKDLERSSMLNILKNLQYANPKEKADATIAIIRKLKGDKKNVYMQSAEYARWRPYFLSLHIENSDLLEEGDTGVTSDTGERIKVPVPKSDYLP